MNAFVEGEKSENWKIDIAPNQTTTQQKHPSKQLPVILFTRSN
jgi:hypothetical protein